MGTPPAEASLIGFEPRLNEAGAEVEIKTVGSIAGFDVSEHIENVKYRDDVDVDGSDSCKRG